ncbi:hypothetical protein IC229_00860 [Spirosoma sp. BT702]|uniref:Uncharacterized protein n=1 Tax=Spirosoma profusum TaxID=2771354 RepID=A0A926XTP8_9BACT|nr:hypothetical protein [Spirosoma profusum]MBD2699166.1 hypothetical protein [Spirosoma profusum]
MAFSPTYHATYRRWVIWLWLGLPLVTWAQQPADSLATKQTGVGVFGPAMGILADTLGVWGDVVLDSASVTGNGVLSLRGHSPNEPAMPQRIVAQRSEVQHLHLASSGKTVLLGDLRIGKSLTVEQGVFDVSAGKLEQSATCQIRLLRGARLSSQPTWTVQNTDPKTRLTNTEQLVGLNADEAISLFGFLDEPQQGLSYELTDYQLIEAENPAPPPKASVL